MGGRRKIPQQVAVKEILFCKKVNCPSRVIVKVGEGIRIIPLLQSGFLENLGPVRQQTRRCLHASVAGNLRCASVCFAAARMFSQPLTQFWADSRHSDARPGHQFQKDRVEMVGDPGIEPGVRLREGVTVSKNLFVFKSSVLKKRSAPVFLTQADHLVRCS